MNGKKATRECPCGYLGHPNGRCRCTPDQVARYRSKLSGPLLDRIDMTIEVPAVSESELRQRIEGEGSGPVRIRVEQAYGLQFARQGKPNSRLSPREVDELCAPDAAGVALLKHAMNRLQLSARGYHRILKLGRTIADLAQTEQVSSAHVAEAIQYRRTLIED